MSPKITDGERVMMRWPAELKERVKAVAGERGISAFAIAAVEAKLATLPEPAAPAEEVADELQVVSVESVDTGETVAHSAQITARLTGAPVAKEGTTPADDFYEEDESPEAVAAMADQVAESDLVTTPPPVVAQFDPAGVEARVDAARERFGLTRASDLPRPVPPIEALPTEAAPTASPATSDAEEVAIENTLATICPVCSSPLISGECWSCAI